MHPGTRLLTLLSVAGSLYLMLMLLHPVALCADTLEVCKGNCRYQTISAALWDVEPGDLVWVRAGEYDENGPVRLKSDVTIRGEDPAHPERTTIRVSAGHAVVGTGVHLTSTCILEGFTIIAGEGRGIYIQNGATEIIRNNIIRGCASDYQGAAIRIDNEGTAPTIINNTFIDNYSTYQGGAIYIEDASPRIVGNQFINNRSERNGGAISARTLEGPGQAPVIEGNVFIGNTAAGTGGAVYLEQSKASLSNNRFESNMAAVGGAICVQAANPLAPAMLCNNYFSANTTYSLAANQVGGAIAVRGQANVLLNGNWISDNRAGTGGGIYIEGSIAEVTNNYLLYNRSSQLTLRSCSPLVVNNSMLGEHITGNIGIQVLDLSSPFIANNIVMRETIGLSSESSSTPILAHNNTVNNGQDYMGAIVDEMDLHQDPRFADLSNNDLHLMPGSRLIDAGTQDNAPLTDYDGDLRPQDGDGDGHARPDVGADEFSPPTPTPSPTPTRTPSATASPTASLTASPTASLTPTPTMTLMGCRIHLPVVWKG